MRRLRSSASVNKPSRAPRLPACCRLHLYLPPVRAVGLLPFTRTLPGSVLAGTKPPLCEPAIGSCSARPPCCPGEPGSGWRWVGLVGGVRMMDGQGVGTLPQPACPLVKEKKGPVPICNADAPPPSSQAPGTKQPSADGKCHSHFDS